MEKVTEHLNEFKSKIPNSVEELQDYLDYLKEKSQLHTMISNHRLNM